eukprot:scaffold2773_cov410-Prasinococcus_capsulatus_cf.AAC.8
MVPGFARLHSERAQAAAGGVQADSRRARYASRVPLAPRRGNSKPLAASTSRRTAPHPQSRAGMSGDDVDSGCRCTPVHFRGEAGRTVDEHVRGRAKRSRLPRGFKAAARASKRLGAAEPASSARAEPPPARASSSSAAAVLGAAGRIPRALLSVPLQAHRDLFALCRRRGLLRTGSPLAITIKTQLEHAVTPPSGKSPWAACSLT